MIFVAHQKKSNVTMISFVRGEYSKFMFVWDALYRI